MASGKMKSDYVNPATTQLENWVKNVICQEAKKRFVDHDPLMWPAYDSTVMPGKEEYWNLAAPQRNFYWEQEAIKMAAAEGVTISRGPFQMDHSEEQKRVDAAASNSIVPFRRRLAGARHVIVVDDSSQEPDADTQPLAARSSASSSGSSLPVARDQDVIVPQGVDGKTEENEDKDTNEQAAKRARSE